MRVVGSYGPGDGGRWRVFVSSTSELRDFPAGGSYVAAVERAISVYGHVVVDMARLSSADQMTAELCRERVRGCDVYVGVLGTRYGSPVRDEPEVSYTELEFNTATEAGLDRLVFLLDTDAAVVGIPVPVLIDREFGVRQDAFRRRVQESGLVTQLFGNPDMLELLVERSLRELAEQRARRPMYGSARRGRGDRPKIFLCYRREDTQGFARGIYQSLAGRYGHEQVFRDIDSTPAGVRYATWIESRVGQCNVMVALIGDAWLSTKDGAGRRRLDSPRDWVRQEIEAALARDISIVPVRIQGARMPSEEDLPPSIADLAGFQSAEVTDSRWDFDIESLMQAIDNLIASD
jgi:hypothetical protein